MSNNCLIILCLLSLYSSTYKPMTQKTFDFGEGVCYYQDVSHSLDFKYVKPCESGKACTSLSDSDYDIRKCLNSEPLPRTLNDDCNTDEDCPGTLICSSKKCGFDGDKPYSGYCPEGKVIDAATDKCKEKTNGNKCEMRDDNDNPVTDAYDNNNTPSYFRMCGLIELKKKAETGYGDHYFEKSVSKSFYCSAPDDSFVRNELLCESGFALYFYGNKEYKSKNNPSIYRDEMYLRCVTVTGIDTENEIVKYKIGDGNEQYYHIDEVSTNSNYKQVMENSINELTMTKLEMFQNYKKRYDQIKEDCKSLLYLDEPETCRDDELRKWYYFYNNPEKYILYQNEPQVMEYLIQTDYKNYKAEHTTDSIGFLSINIMLIFFILISL